jgi:hypothetical protein
MKTTDNSTWRLHEILSALRAGEPGFATRNVFGSVLGVSSSDTVSLYRGVILLISIVDETEARIKRIPNINYALYLRNIPSIRIALTISDWDKLWVHQPAKITETAVADIAYCADLLSTDYRETPLKAEELENIKKEIDELFGRVSNSKINKKLKVIILDLLGEIIGAIFAYKIRGASVLQQSVATAIGQLILHYQDVQADQGNEDLEAVFAFLKRFEWVLAKAMEYKPLLEQYLPALLAAPSGGS